MDRRLCICADNPQVFPVGVYDKCEACGKPIYISEFSLNKLISFVPGSDNIKMMQIADKVEMFKKVLKFVCNGCGIPLIGDSKVQVLGMDEKEENWLQNWVNSKRSARNN